MSSSVNQYEIMTLGLEDARVIDELCDEFEDAWQPGNPTLINEFLDRVKSNLQGVLFQEVLKLELNSLDEAPAIEDYLNRFPHHKKLVTSCFAELFEENNVILQPVDGRFRIIRQIDKGGLGRIWCAEDIDLKREVALKDIRDSISDNAASRDRFIQEAEITGRLEHPGIVPIYALGQFEDGKPYYVMRMIRGQTLRDAIRDFHDENKELDTSSVGWRKLLNRFIDVCNTIHYAHSKNVIHRDIKPDNVMLGEFGETLVVDWGLAKVLMRQKSNASVANIDATNSEYNDEKTAAAGTLQYMSPEQALGNSAKLSPRSDVFSLGATLFCLMTNKPPVDHSRSVSEVLESINCQDFLRPRQINHRVPRPLEAICLKALSSDPLDRYATARDIAEDVERWLAREPVSVFRESPFERMSRWSKRHRSLVRSLLASLGLLIVIGLVAWIGWLRTPGTLTIQANINGALVQIADRQLTLGDKPVSISLPHGVYELEVSADDYFPDNRTIMIDRAETKDLSIVLKRHYGTLNADCGPTGTELEIDGISYGSKIRNLDLPVGKYTAMAKQDGCFDSKPIDFDVRHQQRQSLGVFLDTGLKWTYPSMSIQHDVIPIADVDQDGIRDLLHNELGAITFLSGKTGQVIQTIPANNYTHLILQNGSGPKTLVIGWEFATDQGRTKVKLEAFHLITDIPQIWSKELDCPGLSDTSIISMLATADLDHDASGSFTVATRQGELITLEGANGKITSRFQLTDYKTASDVFLFQTDQKLNDHVFVHYENVENKKTIGMIDLAAKKMIWSKQAVTERVSSLPDIDGDSFREIAVHGDNQILVYSGRNGELRFETQNGNVYGARSSLRNGSSIDWITFHGQYLGRINPENSKQVKLPAPASLNQLTDSSGYLFTIGNSVVVKFDQAVRAINIETGNTEWTIDGSADGMMIVDLDGDGSKEVLLGKNDGLSCHDQQGQVIWHLRLPYQVRPEAIIPDSDGDGFPEIIVVQNKSLIALVRSPRFLWRAKSNGLLLAQPQIADVDNDGQPEIIQVGKWDDYESFGCLDGKTGRLKWVGRFNMPNNMAQAIADFDLDGDEDYVSFGWPKGTSTLHLVVTDLATGKNLVEQKILDEKVSLYTQPIVQKINNDDICDVIAMGWDNKDVFVIDGQTRQLIWRYSTESENIGSLTVADLDDDQNSEVIAPSCDGCLHAIGNDGKRIWHQQLGQSIRGAPVIADLESNGLKRVVVLANQAKTEDNTSTIRMFVLNADDGTIAWSYAAEQPGKSGKKTQASPLVVNLENDQLDHPVIVAALGIDGIAVIDSKTHQPVWQRPFGSEILSTPVITDYGNDNNQELVFISNDGRLIAVDLLTGNTIVDMKISDGQVTAPITVGDLNADNVPDILVAEQNFTLSAIDGRTILLASQKNADQ